MNTTVTNPTNGKMSRAVFRRQIAQQAYQCARWLKANHFEVQHIDRNAVKQPIIIIRNEYLCTKLEGAVEAFERTPDGAYRFNYVVRFDCQVRWDVRRVEEPARKPRWIPAWIVDALRSLQQVGGIHG